MTDPRLGDNPDRNLTSIRLELQNYGLDRFEITEGGWGAGRQVDDDFPMIELDSPEAILAYVRTLPLDITDGWKTSAPRGKKGKC